MKNFSIMKDESGSIILIVLAILTLVTIMGFSLTSKTGIDMQIVRNEVDRKDYFYVAEGGMHREGQEVGHGNTDYAVSDVKDTDQVVAQDSDFTPAHEVMGETYGFTVTYIGSFTPTKGYSATDFSRYDFNVDATNNKVGVKGRYFKIGPKQ